MTKLKNKINQDTILKNFWKDNERFADLFNTCCFNGASILNPDDLTEVDTDVSSLLKFNGHAVLTLCIYYGENEWVGPRSLIDMLNIPNPVKPMISDYKFNLVELRKSEHFNFQNEDVNTIFNISRFIYEKKYDKITDIYKSKEISPELAMVIGSITESQKLIDDAIKSDQKGGTFNMCKALEELEEQERQKGRLEGRSQGEYCGFIKLILKKLVKNKSFEQIVDELELDTNVVRPLYDFVTEHIGLSEDEIIELYLNTQK